MIPHPTPFALLARARGDRAEARRLLREEMVQYARQQSVLAGLSGHCRKATLLNIAPEQHVCRNDGSTCLCVCHDPGVKT